MQNDAKIIMLEGMFCTNNHKQVAINSLRLKLQGDTPMIYYKY